MAIDNKPFDVSTAGTETYQQCGGKGGESRYGTDMADQVDAEIGDSRSHAVIGDKQDGIIGDQQTDADMGETRFVATDIGDEQHDGHMDDQQTDVELGDNLNDAATRDHTKRLNGEIEADESVENAEDDPETNNFESLPIDRGWAWVVLAGATFYLILFGGIRKNFGIFFVAIQDRFGSTASLTSFLTTIQNLTISFSSLLIMTVGMQFMSNRMCVIAGSILLTAANIITAFSSDIRLLFVSIGFLEGAGTALIHPPVTATLGEYFHKRRGLANGLAFSGASFGGLIFAPIMSALFEHIGYSGTLMVVAGMTFNILITGALLRPIKSFQKRIPCVHVNNSGDEDKSVWNASDVKEHEKLLNVEEKSLLVCSDSSGNEFNNERNETDEMIKQLLKEKENGTQGVIQNRAVLQLKANAPSTLKIVRSDSYHQPAGDNKLSVSPLLPRTRAWSVGNQRSRTISQNSQKKGLSPLNSFVESMSRSRVALYASADGVCGSVIDIQEIPVESQPEKKTKNVKVTFLKKLRASFDTSLFKNMVFPIFLLMAAMFAPTSGMLPTFLAPLSNDLGLSSEQAGLLMAIVGGVGMASRIMCALFADKKYVKLTTLLAVASTIAGIVGHCARFFTTFPALVFMAVVFGLCCEIYQSMYPVLLVEYLTLPKLKSCIGFTVLCHGLAVAATFPVVGSLRDATGNYNASYHFLGTMSLIGALLALSLPHIHKRHQIEVKV